MDIMLELCNRRIKNCDLLESVITHEDSLGSDVDKTDVLEKNVVAAINTKLERAESHLQGLNLLYQFLPRISKDSLVNNFPRWISKVTQILNNAHASSIEIVCQTTGALVAKCKKIPELDKNVSINNVKLIIKILVQRYDQDNDGALLNLLIVLLYHYPESCARLQGHYNKIITACIDDINDDIIITGAKCYTLLVRALERSFNNLPKNEPIIFPDNVFASCHVSHQIDLCHNLCMLMDELFQDLISVSVEFPNVTQNNTKIINLELSELSRHNLIDYFRAAQNRFTNICIYLSTLLKIGGNGRKKYVLPNLILQVICKGLAITPANLQENDNNEDRKREFLISILPAFHISLLNVLGDLILCFQQELLPFALTIQRLIVQTLEWTQKCYKRFKDIRILAYKTLTTWLKQAGTLSGFQLVADEFLPHILNDLSPPSKKSIVLTSNKGTKRKSKTQNSKSTQTTSNKDSEISLYSDMELCSQVLSTTQAIVSNANVFLKQSFYIEIRNATVLLLCEQYTKKEYFPVSLENTEYRLQLMKTLQVLGLFIHVSTPPPTAIAIKMFGEAMQQADPDIREEAKLGFAMLRHIIYPSSPSLMLPVYEPQVFSRPSSPMEVVQHENLIFSSHMKRCHEVSKDDVGDSAEPSKRQRASQQESTDATDLFSGVPRCHPVSKDDIGDSSELLKRQEASEQESTDATFVQQLTIENEISNIEISTSTEKSQIDASATKKIPINRISSEPPDSTNVSLKAANVNEKLETDDDMLMSFCDEPIS
ncbi:proline-, glutamic acid- and leucine-rich protein 1-like [Phymastichus coffea]|uniref:proline-, glutamic acid- and leucine-rich protein 1-like n=1 Tax=Phymastichus coffea TaxID=108790 RepID=UPI00273C02EE|nr:proline-, glutamic acid- and leucine-rich protein 1-like [Phymastichus coffea]